MLFADALMTAAMRCEVCSGRFFNMEATMVMFDAKPSINVNHKGETKIDFWPGISSSKHAKSYVSTDSDR